VGGNVQKAWSKKSLEKETKMSNEVRELIKEALDDRCELSPCLNIDCEITRLMLAKELEEKIKNDFYLNKKND